MRLAVLSDDILREELLSNEPGEINIVWLNHVDELADAGEIDGCIDLLFDNTRKRIQLLKIFSAPPVIINSVSDTLAEIDAPFVRINAWPGFLKRPVIEASSNSKPFREKAERIFSCLNKIPEWVPDRPGFITARIIAMIINEAWFALGEGISTKEEIDIAMKLGTNYPYGPFEWGNKIGLENIYELLNKLSKVNSRYQPAEFLKKQVTSNGPYFKY